MARSEKDEMLKQFAIRLVEAMENKGWTQAELARRASVYLDEPMTRQNIYKYVKGMHAPDPAKLFAIAKALEVDPEWLLPPGAHRYDPPLRPTEGYEIRKASARPGWVRIKVNQEVPVAIGMKIFDLIAKADETANVDTNDIVSHVAQHDGPDNATNC